MLRRWGTTVLVFGLLSLGHTPRAMMQGSTPATEPIAVRVADVEGLKLQYLIAGHGPAIVLLHGYAEASRMWETVDAKAGVELHGHRSRFAGNRRLRRTDGMVSTWCTPPSAFTVW